MNSYIGDFTISKTVRVFFNTQGTTGAPITLAGTPAISVYKDSSTTQSTAGVTLSVDFDALTGFHQVVVDTSADGTFYSGGSDFEIVITTGTVDSISVVGKSVGKFSLQNRSPLRPTVADRTLDVTATGAGGVDWGNLENPTTANGLTNTTISSAQVVASVTGAVGSVTGNVGGNVTGSVGSVTGNVGGNVTGSVGSVVGAVGSVTGNVGGNLIGNVNGNVVGSVASVTGNVGGNVVGSVGSVVAGVTVTTNNDKTGYEIAGTLNTLDDLNSDLSTVHGPGSWESGGIAPTAIEIADEVLTRDWTLAGAAAQYSLLNSNRALRNCWSTTAIPGQYVVYEEDGTTPAWQRAYTADPTADPIVSSC